jgi:hypothetical protein
MTHIALPTLSEIEAAAALVYREFQATPQYRWALLSQRLGTDCWVKHENHTPVGAFKIRGGLCYFDQLARSGTLPKAIISATRKRQEMCRRNAPPTPHWPARFPAALVAFVIGNDRRRIAICPEA